MTITGSSDLIFVSKIRAGGAGGGGGRVRGLVLDQKG